MTGHFTVADLTDDPAWDEAVWRLPGANIFVSRPWGAYKARIGWTVRRVAVRCADGQALAYVQYQLRRYGLGRFILAQGCPLMTPRGERRVQAVVRAFLDHLGLGRFDLVAVSYKNFQTAQAVLTLLGHGFAPVVTTRMHTLEFDLTQDLKAMRAGMEARWRDTLARAERNPDLEIEFLTDPAERLAAFDRFSRMYTELKERKGFDSSLDLAAYREVAASDPHLLFLEVRENGEPVLVRMVHQSAHRWTDFFVASTARARATGAGRLALWRLIERAKGEGCRILDLGGVDPAGNPGVFEFKRGLGRTAVTATPLWVFGRTRLVRDAAAFLLTRR